MPNWVENRLNINKDHAHLVVNKEGNVDFNILTRQPDSLNIESSSMGDMDIYLYLSNNDTIPFDVVASSSSAQAYFDQKPNTATQVMIDNMLKSSGSSKIKDAYERAQKCIAEINALSPAELEEKLKSGVDYYDLEKHFTNGKILLSNFEKYGVTTWYEWRNLNWGCKWNASDTIIQDIDEDNILVTFQTPWSPPEPWIRALCARKVDFTLEWYEESGYNGIFTAHDGDLYHEDGIDSEDDYDDEDEFDDDDMNADDETNDEDP